jgi:hypothetical protein
MKILSINLAGDPACVGQNLTKAIKKDGRHTARHLKIKATYSITAYSDLVSEPYSYDHIREEVHSADVLHFNQLDWKSAEFEPYRDCIHAGQRLLFHGHGGAWLLNPEPQIERCCAIGANMVCCSPMDRAVLPMATWVPNIMILDQYHQPVERDFNNTIIIGQAPNHSGGTYKGSEMVRYMCEYLGPKMHGFPIRFEMVTRLLLEKSLRVRAHHHITVDNWTQGFFGMQAFEGLALGHVVFARMDPMTVDAWREFAPEMIPVKNIRGFDTCAAEIRQYCNDRDLLFHDCMAGRHWIENHYSEERILNMWLDYYEHLEPIK